MENQTPNEVLKETLETHPNITEVHFLKDGSYSFNSYNGNGKTYTRGAVEYFDTVAKKKVREFDEKYLSVKTMSRDEILNGSETPKIKEPKADKSNPNKK